MLQASEYDVPDFLSWLGRVHDFRTVEKRKHIVWTTKARSLYTAAWIFSTLCIALTVAAFFTLPILWAVAMAIVLMIGNAFVLPYMLAVVVRLGTFVQRPIERRRTQLAQAKLAQHAGVKIAIAGSYGKTSMREIVRTVLSAGKKVAAPTGSINTPLGIAQFVDQLDGDEDVLVFELGEYYPGDVEKLCRVIRPTIGIITGVNEAHLAKFKSLDHTSDTIFELADFVEGSNLYINADNAAARTRTAPDALLYSRQGIDAWRVTDATTSIDGTSFTLHSGAIIINAHSKLLGLHMIGSIAATAHLALTLGLSVDQVERGIADTKPFAHRLEPKQFGEGVMLLDDSYNGNPDGVRAVIEFLAAQKTRRFYVTPGLVEMGQRTEAVHREIGRQLVEARIEYVVLIRNSVTPFIESGLREADFAGSISWYDDMPQAIEALRLMTVSGDVLLIQNDWPDQYA